MPKKIIQYDCDICKYRFNTWDSAVECEDRGHGEEYPIGCIYGDHTPGDMYANITFAVAKNEVTGHSNWGSSWACRDTGYGDSLGEETCGSPTLTLCYHHSYLNPLTPHFKRMVKWLRSQLIDITMWDGEKAISYATFMKLYREKEIKII
jgi:hypothetical protein